MLPLIKKKLINIKNLTIDSKSGYSGAGRNLNPEKLFEAGTDNYQAYAVGRHRHYPEMLNQIHGINQDIDLLFVPHLSSIERGIYSTHYVTVEDLDIENLYMLYNDYYKDSQFVQIQDQNYPKLGKVNYSNNCLISLFESSADNVSSNLVIISAIDNLVKGASGQAIQNMNIMFSLPETTGLQELT